eukprot:m.923008 g.923008  ORF g.923008 m.923008 type:complete len:93 (+) comp105303_c0_seq1:614-892(+)
MPSINAEVASSHLKAFESCTISSRRAEVVDKPVVLQDLPGFPASPRARSTHEGCFAASCTDRRIFCLRCLRITARLRPEREASHHDSRMRNR